MSIPSSPALVKPFFYDKNFKVDVQLGEPLLCPSRSEDKIKFDLISLCAELDLLCRRELAYQPNGKIKNGDVSSFFKEKSNEITDQMGYLLQSLPLSSPCQKLLSKDSYVLSLYPRAAAVILDQDSFSMTNSECDMDDYFAHLAAMNQVHALASQIQVDIRRNQNVSQLAHKISLLFQSLNNIGTNCVFMEAKKSIEDNFYVLKTYSRPDCPDLQPDVKQWLNILLFNVIQSTLSLPSEITNCVLEPAMLFSGS